MKSFARPKLRSSLPILLVLASAGLALACDSSAPYPAARLPGAIVDFDPEARVADPDRTPSPAERRTRFTARVGPQPWPSDLPEQWPQPSEATVVATTQRGQGERLLLVNWAGGPESALAFYEQALESIGYDVERPRALRIRHALHAEGQSGEAVLTFIEREDHTRIEILFLAPPEPSLG